MTIWTLPEDKPLNSLPKFEEIRRAMMKTQNDEEIGIFDLVKNFKVVGVACSMISTLFSFTFKESIAEPEFTEYYFFPVSSVGILLMSEGFMFIFGSIILTMISDHKKNFNLICMLGTIGFSITMILEGPFWGIHVSRSYGWYIVVAGIAFGGFSGALIMPAAVPAITQIMEGHYSEN